MAQSFLALIKIFVNLIASLTVNAALKKKSRLEINIRDLFMIILRAHFRLFAEIICFAPSFSRAIIHKKYKDQRR